MKVKVINKFTDKHTSKIHEVGEVFECDEARLKEIQSNRRRLVTVIEKDAPKKVQETKKGE
ncbi:MULTISPECIES: hypothetical protein [Lachnospiraceae]|jgi:hypothetical protein|uniref:Uncharacterized protein n=1 Tax=Mediterraneibacter gnavus TaxID=33038 RepID=A0A2N5PMG9_MEDGN|nr:MULTISPECIES: hypothetical protein [Lachnospiraceae]PLT76350.1 hypothetical protein CDL23_04855 [Mediterraneibacter gnavus]